MGEESTGEPACKSRKLQGDRAEKGPQDAALATPRKKDKVSTTSDTVEEKKEKGKAVDKREKVLPTVEEGQGTEVSDEKRDVKAKKEKKEKKEEKQEEKKEKEDKKKE